MTTPQYAPQPGVPAQPQPGVPAQPQWPSQQPPAYPQQGYAAPAGYPQPGYGAPQQGYAAPAQPPVQLAAGSLDAFYAQPSTGGGAGLKFPQVGAAHVMIVNRKLQNSDVEQQLDFNKQPATYKDGRPKFVLKVPVNVPVQANHEDGKGQWYCQGSARDDLARAMAIVGGPEGAPECGAFIYVAKSGQRPIPGGQPANVWDVRYTRPGPEAQAFAAQYGIAYPDTSGAPSAAPPVQAAPAAQAPVAPQAPAAPVAPPAPVVPAQQVQAPAAPPIAPPAPPAPGAANGLPDDKAALLAQLTGQAG